MDQNKGDISSQIVDGVLRFVATGGFLTLALLAPNSTQVFDKPLNKLLDKLDKKSKERELRRVAYYMKRKGLISYEATDYQHGIKLTKAGKARLQRGDYRSIQVPIPSNWDKHWRLVFFDIPISENTKRHSLTDKLSQLGFKQLQKSIWVHPFPCRPEVELVAETLLARKYVTFIEITEIDSEQKLRERFAKLLAKTQYN